jgi:uncharacterized protein YajQ (UPF0234 family)
MASFDILSKVDGQALDNAINVTRKEITNRFDFKDSVVNIDLNKKEMKINLETSDDMKMKQLVEVLINRANKQGISPHAFDTSKDSYASGKTIKQEVVVKNGLKQEDAKKITKLIKDKAENLVEALTEENPSDRMTTLSMLQMSIQMALFTEVQQLLRSPIVIQFCEENGWAI